MEWKNRVTEMLGCKYPIIEGAFHGFGKSDLAAPISEAGGFGMITAGAFRTPEGFRDDIRKCKSMTDKPFGANITIGLCPRVDEMIEVAIEEGIKVVETAAFRAAKHGKRLHEAGVKWIHKVASVRHAIAAEKDDADAVIMGGLDGIGFKSTEQLPSLIAVTLAAQQIKIPVIAAGGFGNARTFLAGLAMGAEAVYMATVFITTKECPVPDTYKQRLVEAKATDPDFLGRALYQASEEDMANLAARKRKGELSEAKWLEELERIRQGYPEDSSLETVEAILKVSRGSLAVGFLDKVVTVKDLIDSIITGAEDILSRGILSVR